MSDAKVTPDPDNEVNLSNEERAIASDEKVAETMHDGELAAEPVADDKVDYIEFLGTDAQYGVEFYAPGTVGHTVTRKQMRENHDVSMTKDLEWIKAAAGKHKGRMLIPAEGLNQETLDILENDPMFKRVSL